MIPGRILLATFLSLAIVDAGAAASFSARPEVRKFVVAMADRHGFDPAELNRQFSQVKPLHRVTRMMTGQYVKPPCWDDYRANFVNPRNVARGVNFWNDHAEALARARRSYGVPEEVVVAILGVETQYGRFPLPYRVFDALATLAFDYPRRAEFFRGELEQYLLLMREEGRNPLKIRGSFAGAMGIPQFMPSSYRNYAVDFDGDGHRDLLHSPTDAIGSVANYLKSYGWSADEPVALLAQARREGIPTGMIATGLKPERPFADELASLVDPVGQLTPSTPVALLTVETSEGPEYWLGLNNFYVISRYNRSLFYALAVHQLAEEIRAARSARSL